MRRPRHPTPPRHPECPLLLLLLLLRLRLRLRLPASGRHYHGCRAQPGRNPYSAGLAAALAATLAARRDSTASRWAI
ncbi:hypothetical protein FJP65_18425 [Stenotrophomonas maltophilia]|nr:hypothetical protein FJP65_18425 [Stenotrophomonas maltophilia]